MATQNSPVRPQGPKARAATFSVGQTATCILLALLIAIGAEATRWQNAAVSSADSRSSAISGRVVPPQPKPDRGQSSDFTSAVTIVLNALTLGVLGFQALIFWRQRNLMSGQLDAANTAAEAAQRQLTLIGLQTDLMEKQKELARQGHIAMNRPRLSIRNIVIKAEQRGWPGQPDLVIGEMLTGQLYVVNKGGYAAEIIDAMVMIFRTDKTHLPMERPYEGQNGNIGRMAAPLLAGKSIPIPFALNEPVSDDVRSRVIEGKDGEHLYVMGWVEYRDGGYDIRTDTQLTRRTAFCRLFDTERQRFVRVQDEDYEHEE